MQRGTASKIFAEDVIGMKRDFPHRSSSSEGPKVADNVGGFQNSSTTKTLIDKRTTDLLDPQVVCIAGRP